LVKFDNKDTGRISKEAKKWQNMEDLIYYLLRGKKKKEKQLLVHFTCGLFQLLWWGKGDYNIFF
jgi:hypothetical protein